MVQCAKLEQELPGLVYRPFQGPLGERIYQEISGDAWALWIEHSKMLVNEYRLDLTSETSHDMLKEQCETFLFGGGAQAPPPEFVPESPETDTE
jgi:Fe-S cluster biosynthesis and repair protein YggX